MLFTKSTKCRQLSSSNKLLFNLRYVNALNAFPESDLLVARTCANAPPSYLSSAFSPASSVPADLVAIFTWRTKPSGEQFACSGCSLSLISMHVKFNTTPWLLSIRASGR